MRTNFHAAISPVRRSLAVAAGLVLLLTAEGCPNQSTAGSLPDGVTPISKNMRGIWNAPGKPGCKWSVRVKSGGRWVTVSSGSGNKSQAVILNSSTVGGQLRSDKCGPWTR